MTRANNVSNVQYGNLFHTDELHYIMTNVSDRHIIYKSTYSLLHARLLVLYGCHIKPQPYCFRCTPTRTMPPRVHNVTLPRFYTDRTPAVALLGLPGSPTSVKRSRKQTRTNTTLCTLIRPFHNATRRMYG